MVKDVSSQPRERKRKNGLTFTFLSLIFFQFEALLLTGGTFFTSRSCCPESRRVQNFSTFWRGKWLLRQECNVRFYCSDHWKPIMEAKTSSFLRSDGFQGGTFSLGVREKGEFQHDLEKSLLLKTILKVFIDGFIPASRLLSNTKVLSYLSSTSSAASRTYSKTNG